MRSKDHLESFGDEGKPSKAKRTSADRFAWHACWHGDAWLGVMELSGLATGIYWKIILRMYIKRGALADDDADMARICNESLKNYRRAKRELIAAGRIVVDEENGILFDERAIRELEAANRHSEAQTARVKKRWKDAKPPRSKPVVVVDNDKPATPSQHELCTEVGSNSASKSISTLAPIVENIEEKLYRGDTTQTHTQIRDQPSKVRGTPPARRSPLNRGGAPSAPDPYPPTSDPTARIEAMKRAMLVGDEQPPPGDQTCRRTAP